MRRGTAGRGDRRRPNAAHAMKPVAEQHAGKTRARERTGTSGERKRSAPVVVERQQVGLEDAPAVAREEDLGGLPAPQEQRVAQHPRERHVAAERALEDPEVRVRRERLVDVLREDVLGDLFVWFGGVEGWNIELGCVGLG